MTLFRRALGDNTG